ncbi:hypothetical protein QLX08_004358 [Tetragonisca angustula]|uniref:Transposase Tc1-like domain-containing protein n=1 Tax=Tetragonisca angustula TaxID=166442 RepID=A0AAW1A5T7_9HYME
MCTVSQSTLLRLRTKHCKDVTTPMGGRPRVLTGQNERKIVRYITSYEIEAATIAAQCLLKDTGIKVSKWTVKRTLKKVNFSACEKKKKPTLSQNSDYKVALHARNCL